MITCPVAHRGALTQPGMVLPRFSELREEIYQLMENKGKENTEI